MKYTVIHEMQDVDFDNPKWVKTSNSFDTLEEAQEEYRHVMEHSTVRYCKILHPDSTEHASITEVLEQVYCQPTKGMNDTDKLERLKELGCDDDVFITTNINTGETSVIIKHS
jgi:hypothetical protein